MDARSPELFPAAAHDSRSATVSLEQMAAPPVRRVPRLLGVTRTVVFPQAPQAVGWQARLLGVNLVQPDEAELRLAVLLPGLRAQLASQPRPVWPAR